MIAMSFPVLMYQLYKILGLDCVNAAADYRSSDSGEGDCANSDDFIFLYEDFEGDRMLVGDVPWE